MCESKVVLRNGDNEDIIMEEAIKIAVKGDSVEIFGILGEKSVIKGKIIEVDMQNHVVVVE